MLRLSPLTSNLSHLTSNLRAPNQFNILTYPSIQYMPLETLRIDFVLSQHSHTSRPDINLMPLELLKMRFKAISYIRRFKPLKYAQVYTNTLQCTKVA